MYDLVKFYKKYFLNIPNMRSFNHEGLSTVLDEEVIKIMTAFSVHITEHFKQIIARYVNVFLTKEEYLKFKIKFLSFAGFSNNHIKILINLWEPKIESMLIAEKKYVKGAINNYDNYIYNYPFLKKFKKYLPDRKYITKNLMYNVKCNPLKYLPLLVYISRSIEIVNKKYIVIFPLKKNNIPAYINIGTTSLVQILMKPRKTYYGKYKSYYSKNISLLTGAIWDIFFKTLKKCFNEGRYYFGNTISTDGIGCSIQQIKKGTKLNKLGKVITKRKSSNYQEFKYLKKEKPEILKEYVNMNIVGIDPGKQDLIYCTNGNINRNKNGSIKPNIFRYSQNQRRKEIKTKKYRDIIKKEKPKEILKFETKLADANSKSCNFNEMLKYIKLKSIIDKKLEEEYKRELYRKLKLYGYINKQKSEQKMINNFKDKFGSPKNTLICIGDWSENQTSKYNEPTKGKSIRKLFKRNGYKLYLINEYNTSKKNFITGEIMEKFRKREHPKAKIISKLKGKMKLWHGLLRSKNGPLLSDSLATIKGKSQEKHILLNRDYNGSMNILKKAKNIIENKKEPLYLK